MHVTYRATVTATLHIGPHECKNRQTVSIWSRHDVSYHNLQSKKFRCKFRGIRGIGHTHTYRDTVTATLHIGPHECKNRQTVSIW